MALPPEGESSPDRDYVIESLKTQMVMVTTAIETNERDLIAAVLRKDRKATAEFVSRYADKIYSYVRYRLIPRGDMVDDLVQDVFLVGLGG